MSLDFLIGTFKSESRFKKRSQIYILKIPDALKEYLSTELYIIPINEVVFGETFFYFLVLDKKEYDAKEKDFKEKFSVGFVVKGGEKIELSIQHIPEKYKYSDNTFYFLGCGHYVEIWFGSEYNRYKDFFRQTDRINQLLSDLKVF